MKKYIWISSGKWREISEDKINILEILAQNLKFTTLLVWLGIYGASYSAIYVFAMSHEFKFNFLKYFEIADFLKFAISSIVPFAISIVLFLLLAIIGMPLFISSYRIFNIRLSKEAKKVGLALCFALTIINAYFLTWLGYDYSRNPMTIDFLSFILKLMGIMVLITLIFKWIFSYYSARSKAGQKALAYVVIIPIYVSLVLFLAVGKSKVIKNDYMKIPLSNIKTKDSTVDYTGFILFSLENKTLIYNNNLNVIVINNDEIKSIIRVKPSLGTSEGRDIFLP